jgi:TP901 family phage tail tape measure protein
MNAYGETAGNAAYISDVLFQTVNVGVLSFEELTQQLGDFVAFGAQSGVKLDQLGIAMAAITRAGVPAAEASTSLNRVLQAFIKPSKEMTAQLGELGYKQGQVATQTAITTTQAANFNKQLSAGGSYLKVTAGQVLTLAQIMELLRVRNGGNIVMLQKLFPEIRAARGAMALWANDGKNLQNVVERFNYTLGATGRALREQQKGLAYQFQIFKNNMVAAFIDIGKGAEGPLKFLMSLVGSLAHAFSSMPGPIKGFIGLMAGVSGAALVALAGYIAFTATMSKLFALIQLRAPIAGKALTALGAAAPWLTAIAVAVTAATLAWGYFRKQQEDVKKLVPDVVTIMTQVNATALDQKIRVDQLTTSYATLAGQNSNISGAAGRFGIKMTEVGAALAGTDEQFKKFTDRVGNAQHKGLDFFGGIFTGDTLARYRLVRDLTKIRDAQKLAQKEIQADNAAMRAQGQDAKGAADKLKELGGNTTATAESTKKLTEEQKTLQKAFEKIIDLPGVFQDMNKLLYAGNKSPQESFADAIKNANEIAKNEADKAKKSATQEAKNALALRKENYAAENAAQMDALKLRNQNEVKLASQGIADLKKVQKNGYTSSLSGLPIADEIAQRQKSLDALKLQNKAEEREQAAHNRVVSKTYTEYAAGVRVSLQQVIDSLNNQADKQNSYYEDMQHIAEVTKDDGGKFIQALRDLGDDAPPIVATLADSTDTEIRKVEAAFARLSPSADKTLTAFRDTVLQHALALQNMQINAQLLTARGFGDLANFMLQQGSDASDALAAAARTTNENLLKDLQTQVLNGTSAFSDYAVQAFTGNQNAILNVVRQKGANTSLQDILNNVDVSGVAGGKDGLIMQINDIKKTLEALPGAQKPKKLLYELDLYNKNQEQLTNDGSYNSIQQRIDKEAVREATIGGPLKLVPESKLRDLDKLGQGGVARGANAAAAAGALANNTLLPLMIKIYGQFEPTIKKAIANGTVKNAGDVMEQLKKAFTHEELEAMLFLQDPVTGKKVINTPGGVQGYLANLFGLPLGKDVDLNLTGPDGKRLTQRGLDPYIPDPSGKNVPITPKLRPGVPSIEELMTNGKGELTLNMAVQAHAILNKLTDPRFAANADGNIIEYFARGGMRENHKAMIAPAGTMRVWAEPETGGEAYIPLAESKRSRSLSILGTVADKFGYSLMKYASGGFWGPDTGMSATALVTPDAKTFATAGQAIAKATGEALRDTLAGMLGSAGLAFDPGHGGVGVDSIGVIERIMSMSGIPAVVTSAFRPGGASYHATHNAVDFGVPGNDPKGLLPIAMFWAQYGPGLAELIYGNGFMGNIKDGLGVGNGMGVYGPATMADHNDHVHVAATLDSLRRLVNVGVGGFGGQAAGVGGARALGQQMAAQYGWTGGQWTALERLWTGESNWDPNIVNSGSGAYGIPQILPSAHGHPVARGDAAGQIAWGLRYIAQRYGDPITAYEMWLARSPHWYAAGGLEQHNAQTSYGTRIWGEPETGGEAYIPLGQSKRAQSVGVMQDVARRFGYHVSRYADGGFNFHAMDLGSSSSGSGFYIDASAAIQQASTGGFNAANFIKALQQAGAYYSDWSNKLGIITKRAGGDVSEMLRNMGAAGRDAINTLVHASDADVKKIVAGLRKIGATAQSTGADLGHMLDQATTSLRDSQEFEKDLLTLAQRNFGNLAMQIQSMGVEQGLPLARAAVSTKNGLQLVGLELSIAGAQNLLGDDLQTGLKIMQLVSQGKGKTGIHAVAAAMQLSESDIVKLLQKGLISRISALPGGAGAKVASDYVKATHGQAYASGGYHAGIAHGLRVFGEPETGGEAYIPLAASKRVGALRVLRQVMHHFGADEYANGGIRLPVGATMRPGGHSGSERVVVVRVENTDKRPVFGNVSIDARGTSGTPEEIINAAWWKAKTSV